MESTDIVVRRDDEEIVAVLLLRRVIGEASEDGMWRALEALADEASRRVLTLDCGQVQYFSSPGLGRLLSLSKRCRAARTRLVIRGLCPSLRQVFQLLRFDVLLEIEADPPAAEGRVP